MSNDRRDSWLGFFSDEGRCGARRRFVPDCRCVEKPLKGRSSSSKDLVGLVAIYSCLPHVSQKPSPRFNQTPISLNSRIYDWWNSYRYMIVLFQVPTAYLFLIERNYHSIHLGQDFCCVLDFYNVILRFLICKVSRNSLISLQESIPFDELDSPNDKGNVFKYSTAVHTQWPFQSSTLVMDSVTTISPALVNAVGTQPDFSRPTAAPSGHSGHSDEHNRMQTRTAQPKSRKITLKSQRNIF